MAAVLRQGEAVEVTVVGAGALNQAVKAAAIARSFLHPSGIDLLFVPDFVDIQIDGQSRTALRLLLVQREIGTTEAGPGPTGSGRPTPGCIGRRWPSG